MARHQYGIFAEGTRSHHHLELSVRPDAGDDALRTALIGVRSANADHRTNGGTNLVIGVGSALAERLGLAAVEPFPGYASADGRLRAPATQRDLWVWVHGPTPDVVVDVVRAVHEALAPVATLALDLPGFVYHDSRDLTGFIDGSANPFLDDAPVVAVVGAGEPGEGGCLAMTMRFEHHLDRFDALGVADQEAVFGRTKPDSIELDAKPADAHISRVEVDDEHGEELKVYRRSVPWATASHQGLHFVAFGADTARFDLQLRHQYGLVDGITDRLLEFTTPHTGSFWRCPSVEDLERVAPLPDDDD
ncbi:MAG: Dyp-type peroxidase [Acidimicrobiales bacterium]